MARKTYDVAKLVDTANHMLALPADHGREEALTPQFRWGVIQMVESALFATGNYRGFRYLSSELVGPDEPHVPNTTYLRIGYDETRRAYYLPRPGVR